MQGKLIRIDNAKVEDREIYMTKVLRSWRIRPNDISAIRLEKVRSLVDEIGVFLEAGPMFFFTDAMDSFLEIEDLLKFKELFGDDWYQRAENGERLSWRKHGTEG